MDDALDPSAPRQPAAINPGQPPPAASDYPHAISLRRESRLDSNLFDRIVREAAIGQEAQKREGVLRVPAVSCRPMRRRVVVENLDTSRAEPCPRARRNPCHFASPFSDKRSRLRVQRPGF